LNAGLAAGEWQARVTIGGWSIIDLLYYDYNIISCGDLAVSETPSSNDEDLT
jgi:hypothetical protein